jgi:DNA polymerase-3 subunit chi
MGIAMFYHLTRSTPEDTLATILPRALAAGWRVMLRGTDQAALNRLDAQLWLDPEDSFLPHGVQGGPHDADQPILLGTGAIGNSAQGLVLLDGAATDPAEAMALERVWVLFDGADPAALASARGLWTRLTAAGLAAQYWSEDGGRWEKKSEKAASVQTA